MQMLKPSMPRPWEDLASRAANMLPSALPSAIGEYLGALMKVHLEPQTRGRFDNNFQFLSPFIPNNPYNAIRTFLDMVPKPTLVP